MRAPFRLYLLIIPLISAYGAASQVISEKCGTDALDLYYKTNFPEYAEFRMNDEKIQWELKTIQKSATTIVIPVVVHVIYRLPEQNISESQIHSQLTVLNKDFNKQNWDTMKVPSVWKHLIANNEITFKLANRDENGFVTNGITRTQTSITDIGTMGGNLYYQTSKGGQNIWDRNKYLNIWVCEIAGGIYGFGSFPGAPAASDGLVIDFEAFGAEGTATSPTDLGRTVTHEVGHWFNLQHLWGIPPCGDDQVSDTPEQEDANYDCAFFPSTSCTNAPDGDMFMNFMDYSDDNCLNFFTEGQKSRMMATLNGSRLSLLSSDGYNGIEKITTSEIKMFPNPVNDFLTVHSTDNLSIIRIQLIDLQGYTLLDIIADEGSHQMTMNLSHFSEGLYLLKLYNREGISSGKIVISRH